MTANFKFNGEAELNQLRALQPNRPLHVTEFWPGWFDHWFEPFHNILSLKGIYNFWCLQVRLFWTNIALSNASGFLNIVMILQISMKFWI